MPKQESAFAILVSVAALVGCLLVGTGCAPQQKEAAIDPVAARNETSAEITPGMLTTQAIGAAARRPPWIAHVNAIDLDRDGLLDVVFCEAQENEVVWLRQVTRGRFEERVLATELRAPVHVEATDIDGDGDLDLAVASMAAIFPNNDRIGSVFILTNDGRQQFTSRTVLANTSRVTDVRPADLNNDGRVDLALAQFGYDQGEVAWLEQLADGSFSRHVLLELSGAVSVGVADFNADGRPDVVALLSQQWEEIHLFQNDGGGRFSRRRLWGSTNEDFGSSGLSIADLNRDGRADILFSNGDGFGPAATPGPRPWHGIQWLENLSEGNFRYHRIGAFPGAYSPLAADLDADGAMDIVASSAYSDWNDQNRSVDSLVWFRNDGAMNFKRHPLSRTPKDVITIAVGDFDGTGRTSIIGGGFYIYPPFDALARITWWRR